MTGIRRFDDPSLIWRLDGRHLREWVAALVAAGESCFICDKPFLTARDAQIDHDHASGRVRGLLCRDCNMGLGCFKDDPDMLIRAFGYLSITESGYIEPVMAARAAELADAEDAA